MQRLFIQDYHVVQTFAPKRADDSLDVGALLRRVRRSQHLPHAQLSHLLREIRAENAIPIPQ